MEGHVIFMDGKTRLVEMSIFFPNLSVSLNNSYQNPSKIFVDIVKYSQMYKERHRH